MSKALVKKEKTPKPVNKGGRPPSVIDEQKLEDMASEDYTIEEIAATVGVNPDTIYTRFSEKVKKGRLRGNGSLKHRLFLKAMEGDTSTLIWLSKQRCGYRDKQPDEAAIVNFNVFVNEIPR